MPARKTSFVLSDAMSIITAQLVKSRRTHSKLATCVAPTYSHGSNMHGLCPHPPRRMVMRLELWEWGAQHMQFT